MDVRKVIEDFCHHFEKMDTESLFPLFALRATVESPALGKKEAEAFYREMFSKTKRFKVVIKDIFVNPDKPHRAALYASNKWETKQGDVMSFESVVIFELNEEGKIQMLHIIYDAQQARDAVRKAG